MLVRRRARAAREQLALGVVLAAGLIGLLAAAPASAKIYSVNFKEDTADASLGDEKCDKEAGGGEEECTLRAAIEESNASTTIDDTIKFDSGFIGDPSDDKIVISGAAPAITDKVLIFTEGTKPDQKCEPLSGILGPCVQLERAEMAPAGDGLHVEADQVRIEGIAVVGMTTGINVVNEAEEFRAETNWLGVRLNGEPGSNGTGIRLAPNSDEGIIGGPNQNDPNVFGNNGTGLDLEGASGASISGNLFGVGPGGGVDPGNEPGANNFKDLEITDYNGVGAESNSVGANLGEPHAGTAACDGSCNVFGSRNVVPTIVNIDLKGDGGLETSASGPNFIAGNHIGLAADGTALEQAEMGEAGVRVGGADGALIGGEEAGAANHINGATYGVLAGQGATDGADDLVVEGNFFGLDGSNTESISAPAGAAIFDSSEGLTNPATDEAEIVNNFISMAGGVGIEHHAAGATIVLNEIFGAQYGIKLWGDSGEGSVLDGNVIENSQDNGVLIENDDNLLVDNLIAVSGAAGVRIQDFLTLASTGNTIGTGLAQGENTISESQGDAIEVAGDEDDETMIARNNGGDNTGLFIDLGADGPGNAPEGPNNGIQAPAISSATSTAASGTALPGADVRVFIKATGDAGEIDGFLGQTTADGSGSWTVAYGGPITGGTNVGATQTGLLGTSELAIATTTAPPPQEGGGSGAAGGSTAAGDETPPQTKILKGPKKSRQRTAKFKFSSSEQASKFRCKLDGKPYKACSSPKKYKKLKPGRHVFKVFAIDSAGNKDPTPAVRKFRVLP